MNQTALTEPRGFAAFETAFRDAGPMNAPVEMRPELKTSEMAVSSVGGVVSAQRVAVPRDLGRVMNRMKVLATAAGDRYIYSIPYEDRRNNRKVYVEGPTVKLALDLVREYGNCQVRTRVMDEGDHWIIYAQFTDIETGFTLERPFQQRKGQNTGMRDNARALDQVLQIGVSKSIRNVIVNALGTLVEYVIEETKSSILARVADNPEGARAVILKKLEELAIQKKRVERVYGRKAEKWTAPDMAKLYTEIQAIADGMADADDLFPEDTEAEQEEAAREAREKSKRPTKPASKPAAKSDPESAPAPEPAADPEPNQEPGPSSTHYDPQTGEIVNDAGDGGSDDDVGTDDEEHRRQAPKFGFEE
jgi:hypothetical protein